jgi:hypothetical protein
MRYPLRFLVTLVLLGIPAAAQTANLQLGSATVASGAAFTLPLTLSGGAGPAALQWVFRYPPIAFTAVPLTVAPTAAAVAAGKSVTCTSMAAGTLNCILFGLNTTALADGDVATISGTLVAGTNLRAAIDVSGAIAATGAGSSAPIGAAGGAVMVLGGGDFTLPASLLRASGLQGSISLVGDMLYINPLGSAPGPPGPPGPAGVGVAGPAGPPGPAGPAGAVINFMDDDAGAVENADGTLTLSQIPNPASSLAVFVNGLRYKLINSAGVGDLTISGKIVTFTMRPLAMCTAPHVPSPCDYVVANYRY